MAHGSGRVCSAGDLKRRVAGIPTESGSSRAEKHTPASKTLQIIMSTSKVELAALFGRDGLSECRNISSRLWRRGCVGCAPGGLSTATDDPVAAVGGEAPVSERSRPMYPCAVVLLSKTRSS